MTDYTDPVEFEYQPPGITVINSQSVVIYHAEDYGYRGNSWWQLNRPGDEYGVPQWSDKITMIRDLQRVIEHLSSTPEGNQPSTGATEQ